MTIKEPPCPECGQHYIAKGTTVHESIERILDEHSAWIARPSVEVTRAVALAATLAAHQIVDADHDEAPYWAIHDALRELLAAGDAMLAFLITARPEVLGEAEWERQYKARSERQRNAITAAHAALDIGRPMPPHGSGPTTDSRRG